MVTVVTIMVVCWRSLMQNCCAAADVPAATVSPTVGMGRPGCGHLPPDAAAGQPAAAPAHL